MSELKYKKILLKISGEALLGEQEFGIDPKPVEMIAHEIKKVHDLNVQIAVVVGGGNIFRGMKNSAKLGMDQASGDYVGMLATIMNALCLQDTITKLGAKAVTLSSIEVNKVCEFFTKSKYFYCF